MRKKFIIEKQDTITTGTETETDSDEYFSDTQDVTQDSSNYNKGVKSGFKSITNVNYKKPASGSRQDNFSREDILGKIENCIPLKTMKEKEILTRLPLFKTWIKYYNTEKKQFRTGGLLMKVEYPKYIMLVNTINNITWSVQLNATIIYIPHPKSIREKEEQRTEQRENKEKENLIKTKLYDMYKQGRLTTK
jgi:hypothetical protein